MWQDIFRGFLKGKIVNGKLVPDTGGKKHIADCKLLSWNEAKQYRNIVGFLKPDFVDVSFDDPYEAEAFDLMRHCVGWKCAIQERKENGHIHTFWKIPKGADITGGADKYVACGLKVDIHHKMTSIRIRQEGQNREFTVEDTPDMLPDDLLPMPGAKDPELFQLCEGDGRNEKLSSYVFILNNVLHLPYERTKEVIRHINGFIFLDPLSDDELESTVLRDETFEKMKASEITADSFDDDGDDVPKKKGDVEALEVKSIETLMSEDLPPIRYIVDDILPSGLTIIASPPKFGKSFFCLQLLLAVTGGQEFLGFRTHKCDALYLDLEDSDQRLKSRLETLIGLGNPPKGFYRVLNAPSLGHGLIDTLQAEVDNNPDLGLIVIDTLVRIRDGGRKNEDAYTTDSRELGGLFKFATENNIAVLLVHHTRKMKDTGDPFANIGGTQGLTGSCDTMIVLSKIRRTDKYTIMDITGRSVETSEYSLYRSGGKWERSTIDAAELRKEDKEDEIINSDVAIIIDELLKDSGSWKGTCKELIEESKRLAKDALHLPTINMTPQALGKWLNDKEIEEILFAKGGISHTLIKRSSTSYYHKFDKVKEKSV